MLHITVHAAFGPNPLFVSLHFQFVLRQNAMDKEDEGRKKKKLEVGEERELETEREVEGESRTQSRAF